MKMTKLLAAGLTVFALSPLAMAAQFYKWTDEQGVTHYSEEPPPASAGKASEVKVRTRLPSGAQTDADAVTDDKAATKPQAGKPDKKEDKAATKPDESKAPPEQYAERCKSLKENLEAMQSRGRVRETGADGSVRALTDEEKQQRLDDTQRQIKAFCEG